MSTPNNNNPIQPSHYNANGVECQEVIRQVFGEQDAKSAFVIQAFEMIWRHRSKGGDQDLRKAVKWLQMALGESGDAEAEEWKKTAYEVQDQRDQAREERDRAIKERDKWYQAYSNHSGSIVRLMAKIDDLTAKASTT